VALVKMVEDRAVPVPYAFMRTAILSIKMYPSLKAIVADNVVPKLVEREVRRYACVCVCVCVCVGGWRGGMQ
jgi:hypothetical protein